jgi:hypothetical protein
MKQIRAGEFFKRCCVAGRAVLRYRPSPDDRGRPQPQLWLCIVGTTIVACDDDGGFIESVKPDTPVSDVAQAWRCYAENVKTKRRVARNLASQRVGRTA